MMSRFHRCSKSITAKLNHGEASKIGSGTAGRDRTRGRMETKSARRCAGSHLWREGKTGNAPSLTPGCQRDAATGRRGKHFGGTINRQRKNHAKGDGTGGVRV